MDEDSKKHNPEAQHHVEEAFKEAEFEDKVWLFWNKYNRHIVLCAVLVIFGYMGYFGINLYKQRQLDKLQEEYRDAADDGRELTFAERNSREPLAGLVFLQTGDQAYKAGNYSEAIQHYNNALKSLNKTPVASRARLNIAMANILNGDTELGHKELEALLADNKAMAIARAGAAYQLALLEMQSENFSQAKAYLELAINNPNSGIWGEKSLILKNTTAQFID